MPGIRNYARERSQHAVDAPQRQRAIYDLLQGQLPHKDAALIGWPAILAALHDLGIRRLNGRPLNATLLKRWRKHGLPILSGNRHHRLYAVPPVTSSFALTAWLLSRFHNGALFTVTLSAASMGTRPANLDADAACAPRHDQALSA